MGRREWKRRNDLEPPTDREREREKKKRQGREKA